MRKVRCNARAVRIAVMSCWAKAFAVLLGVLLVMTACGGSVSHQDPTYPLMMGQQTITLVGYGQTVSSGTPPPPPKWRMLADISATAPTGDQLVGYTGTVHTQDSYGCGLSTLQASGYEMRGAYVKLTLSDAASGTPMLELSSYTGVNPISTKDGRLNGEGTYKFLDGSVCSQDVATRTGAWFTEYN